MVVAPGAPVHVGRSDRIGHGSFDVAGAGTEKVLADFFMFAHAARGVMAAPSTFASYPLMMSMGNHLPNQTAVAADGTLVRCEGCTPKRLLALASISYPCWNRTMFHG